MNAKKWIASAGSIMLAGALWGAAQTAQTPATGLSWEPGSGISFNETPVMTAEFGLACDSKYMFYGLVLNNDPILRTTASATFFDFLTFDILAIYDVTKYGRKAGYTNRAGKYTELDPDVYVSWSFSPDEHAWLPTTVDVSLGYMYEYHPRSMDWNDMQYVWAEIALPDLWIEPLLYIEREIDSDNGTYVNLEIGHTFPLIDNDEEDGDPVLAFRPSVAQGFGNTQRVRGYLCSDWEAETPLDHAGLMDTCIKGELTWTVCDWLSVSGYVAYYDFLFDSTIRESVRGYESTGRADRSYNYVDGLAVTATF
jgi:hypothetical protein